MLQLDNITTQNGFPGDDNDPAGSLSDQHSDLLSLDVAGAPVYVQFRPYDSDRENLLDWGSDQMRVVAPKSLLIPDVAGVRVRSATPGTPASVTAQLFEPDDPGRPSAASSAVQVITTVGQIGVQHNGALQDSENTLDFEDSAEILFTVTPDPTHGRVQVDAAIAPSAFVSSFAGRTGAVVATAGDYTAAQVTNAADKSSAAAQVFSASIGVGVSTGAFGQTGIFLQTGAFGTIWVASPASNNSVLIASVAGDTERRLDILAGGSILLGPGNAATDTTVSRVVNTAVLGNSSGTSTGLDVSATAGGFLLSQGGAMSGAVNNTGSGLGPTLQPDLSAGNQHSYVWSGTAGTTLTIANCINRPPPSATGPLFIKIRNSGTVTLTLSWGTGYAFGSIAKPTSLIAGAETALFFMWDNSIQTAFRCVGIS